MFRFTNSSSVPRAACAGRIVLTQCRRATMVGKKLIGSGDKSLIGKRLQALSVDASMEEKLRIFECAKVLKNESFISTSELAEKMVQGMQPDIQGKPFVHINGGPGVVSIAALKSGAKSASVTDPRGVFYPLMLNYLRFYGNFHVHKMAYDSMVRVSSETTDRVKQSMKTGDVIHMKSFAWEDEEHPLVMVTPMERPTTKVFQVLVKAYDLRLGFYELGRPIIYTFTENSIGPLSQPAWYHQRIRINELELACRYHIECVNATLPLSIMMATSSARESYKPDAFSTCMLRCVPKLKPDFPPGVASMFMEAAYALALRSSGSSINLSVYDTAMHIAHMDRCLARDIVEKSGLPPGKRLVTLSPSDWLQLAFSTEELAFDTFDSMCGSQSKAASSALDLAGFA